MGIFRVLFACAALIFLPVILPLAGQEDAQKKNVFQMSLDELLATKVISASRRVQSSSRAPATILVITKKQIRERGYQELDDALRDIPGIDFIRVHGVFPILRTIRGSYGDENKRLLLMIDGIVENTIIGSFEMGGPAYSLHHVERIEVILGPASALYGANAFSGIINIITKMPQLQKKKDKTSFSYEKGYGSFNTAMDTFSLVHSAGHLGLSLGGSLYSTDGPRFSNRHPEYSDAYVDKAFSLVGRLIYKTARHQTILGFHSFETPMGDGTLGNSPTKLLGLPGMGNMNLGNAGWYTADIEGQRASHWHPYTRTLFLESQFQLTKLLSLTWRSSFRETGLRDDSYSFLSLGSTTFSKNHLTHQSHRISGEIQVDYSFNQNQYLTAGVLVYRDNIEKEYRKYENDAMVYAYRNIFLTNLNTTFLERESTNQHNYGIYGQYVIETGFLKSTSFTIGSRYDYNSLYGAVLNPRLGIVINPMRGVGVKLLYGKAFRAPSSFELYSSAPIRVENPDLKPEKIDTLELELSFSNKKLMLRGNLFYNRLTNLIVEGIPIENDKEQNQNKGTANITGFELYLNYVFSKRLRGFTNISFQEGNQTTVGTRFKIANIAAIKGNLGLNWDIRDLMNIYFSANWVGRRSVPESNPLGYVKGYFLTNLAFTTKRFIKDQVSASLVIKNLFNTENFDPGIRAASGSFVWATVHDQPGVSILCKFMLHF